MESTDSLLYRGVLRIKMEDVPASQLGMPNLKGKDEKAPIA